MSKAAFIFPGQGAQYVGMGKELSQRFTVARETFESAQRVTGINLSEICFDGPEGLLGQTQITQPAVFTVSVACLRVVQQYGIKPDCVAGLSLGEYTALVAAQAMDFNDAVGLVRNRGRYMDEAAKSGTGIMAAILGLSDDLIEQSCQQARSKGFVMAANFNCPGQVVISGEKEAVLYAGEIAKENGARKVIVLDVSGAFHTPLMAEAAGRLSADVAQVSIDEPQIPIISNVTADAVHDQALIRECLIRQVVSPVKWRQSVEWMIQRGVERFVEIGPGTTLSGHIKRIDKRCSIWNVEDIRSLETLLDSW